MAKGRRSIPTNLATGKGIYPIIPYRARIDRAGNNTVLNALNNGFIVDFDLQFEDNEVMDLIAIEWQHNAGLVGIATPATDETCFLASWLLENPELAADDFLNVVDATGTYPNVGASVDDSFVTNSALVHYKETVFSETLDLQAATNGRAFVTKTSNYSMFTFPQPYTVARNVLVNSRASLDTDESSIMTSYRVDCTIWGRRRKAADSEFKNIIYRQRF